MTDYNIHLSLQEVCIAVELPEPLVFEVVEQGIVHPLGNEPGDWSFDLHMVNVLRRATRLHRDLELDWATVALVVDLVDQREQLRHENRLLKRRLGRFIQD